MNIDRQQKLFKAIDSLESQLEYVKGLIHDAIPQSEWLDTKEFAERAKLQHRTVTNYVGKGNITNFKKSPTGRYLIHFSELERWGK